MRRQPIQLDRDTPATMIGLEVTIMAGQRLLVGEPDENDVCVCWTTHSRHGGPAALVGIRIAAEHLPLREKVGGAQ